MRNGCNCWPANFRHRTTSTDAVMHAPWRNGNSISCCLLGEWIWIITGATCISIGLAPSSFAQPPPCSHFFLPGWRIGDATNPVPTGPVRINDLDDAESCIASDDWCPNIVSPPNATVYFDMANCNDGDAAAPPNIDFLPSKSFTGKKAGFFFSKGSRGVGYYRDALCRSDVIIVQQAKEPAQLCPPTPIPLFDIPSADPTWALNSQTSVRARRTTVCEEPPWIPAHHVHAVRLKMEVVRLERRSQSHVGTTDGAALGTGNIKASGPLSCRTIAASAKVSAAMRDLSEMLVAGSDQPPVRAGFLADCSVHRRLGL